MQLISSSPANILNIITDEHLTQLQYFARDINILYK